MEEQIRKHERIIIKLKRARNSLLNVSKLPPEVLGDIFRRNVTLEDDFDDLEKRSRNFLFVCHHWSEIALGTPEVWSFWGGTLKDWARWHRHSETAPLDLVLSGAGLDNGTLNVTLRDTLQDRAVRDTIRRIHLWSGDTVLLSSIISPFATAGEGDRPNSVESFILINNGNTPVDTSDFFARYRFPKLQRLKLYDCKFTSWDLLTSRTAVLTTLSLCFSHPSPTPNTPQLFSILASNPSLRRVSLSGYAVPLDGGGESPYRVSLHHLKLLKLAGGLRHIIGLLHQLDHPTNLDLMITLSDRTVTDVPRMVGPYLRDYLRRRDRSPNGLGLYVSRSGCKIKFRVGDMGGIDLSVPTVINLFVEFVMNLNQTPLNLLENVFLDLFPYTPQDEVVYLHSWGEPAAMEDISTRFPKLRALNSGSMPLSAVFPGSRLDEKGGIPTSLQHIVLEWPVVDNGDWSPMTNFLASRSSSGNQLDSLTLSHSPHMGRKMEERIRSIVKKIRIT